MSGRTCKRPKVAAALILTGPETWSELFVISLSASSNSSTISSGAIEIASTVIGERHAARAPIEQRHAEALLERRDGLADGRLRQAGAAGGGREPPASATAMKAVSSWKRSI